MLTAPIESDVPWGGGGGCRTKRKKRENLFSGQLEKQGVSLEKRPSLLGPQPGSSGGGDAVKHLIPSPWDSCTLPRDQLRLPFGGLFNMLPALIGICLIKRGCFALIGC